MRALGIDPGTRRIGIAVSDLTGTIASPLMVLQRSKSARHDLAELAKLAKAEEADVIVVGLPINMDGTHGPAAQAATRFAARLATVAGVPVELHDERRTTVTAEQAMREGGLDGRARRQRVDKVAAAVMLQSWLDKQRARR
jgi:putative Holliday junction resolvase